MKTIFAAATVILLMQAATAMCVDFNNDGYEDLVVSTYLYDTDYSYVAYGSADGYTEANRVYLQATYSRCNSIADLNQDGYEDIIFNVEASGPQGGPVNYSVNSLIYWGSDAGFSETNKTELPTVYSGQHAVGDLNSDGYPDIVFTNAYTDSTSYIYWGSQTGYSEQSRSELPTDASNGITIADIDGDFYLDIIFSCIDNSIVYWGSETGFSTDQRTLLPTIESIQNAVGDFNKDGYNDIVFSDWGSTNSVIFWGSQTGFDTQNKTNLPTTTAQDVSAVDLNGDTYLDIVFSQSFTLGSAEIRIYWGSPGGFDTQNTSVLPTLANHWHEITDLDNDGHLDIIVANPRYDMDFNQDSYIYWGSGDGTYSETNRTEFATTAALQISSTAYIYTRKAVAPSAYEHTGGTMIACGGKLYWAGGYIWHSSRYLTGAQKLEVYDPATGLWTELADLPDMRCYMGAFVLDNQIYFIGGEKTYTSKKDTVWKYDPATDTWDTSFGSLPEVVCNVSEVVIDGVPYITGGHNYQGDFLNTYRYDVDNDTWVLEYAPSDPQKHRQCASSTYDGKIYYFGSGENQTTDLTIYDPVSKELSYGTSMPSAIFNNPTGIHQLNSVTYNNYEFIISFSSRGDSSLEGINPNLYVYSFEDDLWYSVDISEFLPVDELGFSPGHGNDQINGILYFHETEPANQLLSLDLNVILEHIQDYIIDDNNNGIHDSLELNLYQTDTAHHDFNNDGYPDIIFVNHTNNPYICWGDADYSYSDKTNLPCRYAIPCKVADLNQDGYLDIVMGIHRAAGYVYTTNSLIFWGDASAQFDQVTELPTSGCFDIYIDDIDKDGFFDIVFANNKSNSSTFAINSYIYWGDATYTYSEKSELYTEGATGIAVADLNKDGFKDIVFSNAISQPSTKAAASFIYWGNQDRTFSDRTDLPTDGANDCEIVDFNGDGWPDIIFANGINANSNAYLYWGGEINPYTTKLDLPAYEAIDVSVADLNSDRYLDIVITNYHDWNDPSPYNNSTYSFIYWGNPNYTFVQKTELATRGAKASDIADLNNDGYPEIIFGNDYDGTYFLNSYIYWGNPTYTYKNRTEIPTAGVWDVSIGYATLAGNDPGRNDADNDGLTDYEELHVYFTDPDIPDSDNDGITDYDEVVTYNCNPLSSDSDNDRLKDSDELYKLFTSPFAADTDNDGIIDSKELRIIGGHRQISSSPFKALPLVAKSNDLAMALWNCDDINLKARLLTKNAEPIGNEFTVASISDGVTALRYAVASDGGTFFIIWVSDEQNINGIIYDSSGTVSKPTFTVISGNYIACAITSNGNGYTIMAVNSSLEVKSFGVDSLGTVTNDFTVCNSASDIIDLVVVPTGTNNTFVTVEGYSESCQMNVCTRSADGILVGSDSLYYFTKPDGFNVQGAFDNDTSCITWIACDMTDHTDSEIEGTLFSLIIDSRDIDSPILSSFDQPANVEFKFPSVLSYLDNHFLLTTAYKFTSVSSYLKKLLLPGKQVDLLKDQTNQVVYGQLINSYGEKRGKPFIWNSFSGASPLIVDVIPDADSNLNVYYHYLKGATDVYCVPVDPGYDTDPHSADTDSDGMPDGFEVTYLLDPTEDDADDDHDNDGYTNIVEYTYQTNPRDANDIPQITPVDFVAYVRSIHVTGNRNDIHLNLQFLQPAKNSGVISMEYRSTPESSWSPATIDIEDGIIAEMDNCSLIWHTADDLPEYSALVDKIRITITNGSWSYNHEFGPVEVYNRFYPLSITHRAYFSDVKSIAITLRVQNKTDNDYSVTIGAHLIGPTEEDPTFALLGSRELAADSQTTLSITEFADLDPGRHMLKLWLCDTDTSQMLAAFDSPLPIIVDPLDCDRDGIPDSYEKYYGSDPTFDDIDTDVDCDGLTLFEEFLLGTDPRCADTDHDGQNDSFEDIAGTDPLDSALWFELSFSYNPDDHTVTVTWPCAPERTYSLWMFNIHTREKEFKTVSETHHFGSEEFIDNVPLDDEGKYGFYSITVTNNEEE